MNLNILSYNVNRFANFKKRKKIFTRLRNLKADIILAQEMHSSVKTENLWKSEWGGKIIYSHGESNARGIAIMIRRNLNI